jgi:hypothetical protein
MMKLFSIEEIRSMMGSTEPIEGCLIVEVNLQLMQVAFTTERPPAECEWRYFEYEGEYDPRACIPLFAAQSTVYGVFLGPAQGGIPLAVLSPARGAKFGTACFGEGHRFNLLVHEAAHAAFRNHCVRLGDRLVVAFPYDPKRVEWSKANGGKFFADLKAWVFPAEKQADVENVLLTGQGGVR